MSAVTINCKPTLLTFIALPLVSMGSNNAATDANTENTTNKLIVPMVV